MEQMLVRTGLTQAETRWGETSGPGLAQGGTGAGEMCYLIPALSEGIWAMIQPRSSAQLEEDQIMASNILF